MRIFIEVPTWLGDTVMTTPAIENLILKYPNAKLTIFGSFVSTEAFKYHPCVEQIIIDNTKKKGNRYFNLFSLAKSLEKFDIAISFRKHFATKFLFFFLNANQRFVFKKYTNDEVHQVIRYNDFINESIGLHSTPGDLKLYLQDENKKNTQTTLGINPGATYGSAKRWYPIEFAKVAIEYSKTHDIVIFGGPAEVDIAKDIEDELIKANISNYTNLSGKTSVSQLISNIASCDLFITGDSGPMHVAAAFKIPTISIFGPTRDKETSQWNNPQSKIVKKDFDCQPCMKRVCPLLGEENHQCMKAITAQDILDIEFK